MAFQSVCPLMEKDKRFMEASWWERLTEGKLGLVLKGRAMISESLDQFSVDGWSCALSLLFTCRQTMVDVIKIMVASFKGSHAHTATVPPTLLQASIDPRLCWRLLDTHNQVKSYISKFLHHLNQSSHYIRFLFEINWKPLKKGLYES